MNIAVPVLIHMNDGTAVIRFSFETLITPFDKQRSLVVEREIVSATL